MSNEQEITDIVIQLQRLHLQQSELLQRLAQLSEVDNNDPPQQPSAPRECVIGDPVRINNPNQFQARSGRVIKIGTSRITVLALNRSKIYRAVENAALKDQP